MEDLFTQILREMQSNDPDKVFIINEDPLFVIGEAAGHIVPNRILTDSEE